MYGLIKHNLIAAQYLLMDSAFNHAMASSQRFKILCQLMAYCHFSFNGHPALNAAVTSMLTCTLSFTASNKLLACLMFGFLAYPIGCVVHIRMTPPMLLQRKNVFGFKWNMFVHVLMCLQLTINSCLMKRSAQTCRQNTPIIGAFHIYRALFLLWA